MSKFFVYTLSNGRSVQVDPTGTVRMLFDDQGRPDVGNLSPAEKRELAEVHAQAFSQDQHDTAVSRTSDPRFADIRSEIFRRGTLDEIETINQSPVHFNEVFERLHGEVGKSYAELSADVDRADRVTAITDKLAERAEKGLSQDLGDVAELINIQEAREAEEK